MAPKSGSDHDPSNYSSIAAASFEIKLDEQEEVMAAKLCEEAGMGVDDLLLLLKFFGAGGIGIAAARTGGIDLLKGAIEDIFHTGQKAKDLLDKYSGSDQLIIFTRRLVESPSRRYHVKANGDAPENLIRTNRLSDEDWILMTRGYIAQAITHLLSNTV